MMNKESSTKIVKIMTIGSVVLLLGRSYTGRIVNIHNFLKIYFSTTGTGVLMLWSYKEYGLFLLKNEIK